MENNLSARELESVFLNYSPYWEGWLKQQCNSLIVRDIRLLNAKFKYNTTTTFTQTIPKSTLKRLGLDLPFYRKWVAGTFKSELKSLFSTGPLCLCINDPISGLDLDKELIGILQRFGKNNVQQIMDGLSEDLLTRKPLFENILKFKERLNEIDNANKMKTNAVELKKAFACYVPFWDEWVNYKFNTLTDFEIDAINKLALLGFNIQTHLIDETEIQAIITKLKESHSHYISWAIMKFEFMLIKMFDIETLEADFERPISQLKIDDKLKEILLRFNTPTLNLLFEHKNKSKLGNGKFFVNILLFRERLNELKKTTELVDTWSARLARVIKVLRLDKKINQSEMSQLLNMDRRHYAQKEKTELHLNMDQMVAVAEKFELTIYQLIAIVHADVLIGVASHSIDELEKYFKIWNQENHAAVSLNANVLNELKKQFSGGKGPHSPGKQLLTPTGRVLAA